MKINKKIWGSAGVAVGLITTVLSFQNCSQNQGSSAASTSTTTSSGTTTTTSSALTALNYPVTTAVVLVPGQSTTLKIAKPSTMGDVSNYIWYVYNDNHALAAHYGLPVEANGYLYISLTLRSDFTGTKDLRVYLYNFSSGSYLDGNGVKIQLNSVGTAFSSDAGSELCDIRADYVPSFSLNKSSAIADALYVFDNGGGIGTLSCTFTDSSGNTSASVDCLNTSAWPSGWASQTMKVYATNRCGASYTQSF